MAPCLSEHSAFQEGRGEAALFFDVHSAALPAVRPPVRALLKPRCNNGVLVVLQTGGLAFVWGGRAVSPTAPNTLAITRTGSPHWAPAEQPPRLSSSRAARAQRTNSAPQRRPLGLALRVRDKDSGCSEPGSVRLPVQIVVRPKYYCRNGGGTARPPRLCQ